MLDVGVCKEGRELSLWACGGECEAGAGKCVHWNITAGCCRSVFTGEDYLLHARCV